MDSDIQGYELNIGQDSEECFILFWYKILWLLTKNKSQQPRIF